MRCDIIIPVWNQLEVTKDCVESILKTTRYPYRLIIIDNASDRDTAAYLEGLKAVRALEGLILIRNESNLGFVKAVNRGIRASDGPFVCVMNNDTIAAGGWLEEMMLVLENNPEIGLLNPSSNTSGQFPAADESIEDYAAALRRSSGRIQELYTCRGFCMIIRREVIDRLGILDEAYHIGYFDDTDYCKKAQEAGYMTARAKGAYVWHRENVSFKTLKENKELFRKNEEVFFRRWGRPVRVGYFVDSAASGQAVNDIAVSVARKGHPIFIFLKKGLKWPVGLDHFDIRRFDLNGIFFGFIAIYKIFKRRKKKRLEIVLTDNRLFGDFLRAIRGLHGSDVIINPRPEEVLAILEEKSKKRTASFYDASPAQKEAVPF